MRGLRWQKSRILAEKKAAKGRWPQNRHISDIRRKVDLEEQYLGFELAKLSVIPERDKSWKL